MAELSRLGEAVRNELERQRAERPCPPVEARLENIANERRLRKHDSSPKPKRSIAVASVVGFLVALLATWVLQPAPVGFEVGADGQRGRVGETLEAGPEGQTLSFHEGSSLALRPKARARVDAVTANGARVVLEAGSLTATVTHRDSTRWVVAAGLFEIRVTGTRFDASLGADGSLEVVMHEGSVNVVSACSTEGQVLHAEQRRVFHCSVETAAHEPVASGPTALQPAPSPMATQQPSQIASANTRHPPSVPSTNAHNGKTVAPDWRALARAARYQDAWAAAAPDLDALRDTLSAEDALLLASSARLAKQPAAAERLYLAVRQRHGGNAGSVAAFELGRLAFDMKSDHAAARRWFNTYLNEAPNGSWAAQALGRRLEAERQLGDDAGASRSAAEYLRRFPNGPHAPLARRALRSRR